MSKTQIIEADLTLIGDEFKPGLQVELRPDGTIGRVGPADKTPTVRLERQALMPGMVNAHSHAFQRALRGCAEQFPRSSGNFWVWRDEMYGLVNRLDADSLYEACRLCFLEMLAAGITTVGEFHYLHHASADGGFVFDDTVLNAARDTGIRIVLLNACYLTGDIGLPLGKSQRRFDAGSLACFLKQVDRVSGLLTSAQTQGLVAHSVRAVPIDDLVALHRKAKSDDVPFHMHLEEQNLEIDACLLKYKARPMELLLDRLDIGQEFTAVHCTHSHDEDMTRFIDTGANVCICPLTEANLGDGIAQVARMWALGAHVCLGTDSNARIDFNEEMRWLEYVQRLKHQGRGVCADGSGSVAAGLWLAATVGGARSLGLRTGMIAPDRQADLITIDLDAPQLVGLSPESLLTSFVLGADARAIKRVCVAGNWLI